MDAISTLLSEAGLENTKENRDRAIKAAEEILALEEITGKDVQFEIRRWGDDQTNVKRSMVIKKLKENRG